MKKNIILPLTAFLLICIFLLALFYIKIPYVIKSNGIVQPALEWRLDKTIDGKIINTLKNHLTNTVTSFSATEFQRGDLVQFSISNKLHINSLINENDTIGYISSHEENLRLLQLKRELEENKRQKEVFLTGEKPEVVAIAYQEMLMAEQEFDTQQKIINRLKSLHDEDLIADQEYELAQNDFNIKKQQVAITRANYQSLISGAKKEEIALIDAAIHYLTLQINQTEKRIDALTIVAPLSGKMISNTRELTEMETLARIISVDRAILIMPVEIGLLDYFQQNDSISFKSPSGNINFRGYISHIDSEIHQLSQRQMVFVTSEINKTNHLLLPNLKVTAQIDCGNITLFQYIIRLSKTVYSN